MTRGRGQEEGRWKEGSDHESNKLLQRLRGATSPSLSCFPAPRRTPRRTSTPALTPTS